MTERLQENITQTKWGEKEEKRRQIQKTHKHTFVTPVIRFLMWEAMVRRAAADLVREFQRSINTVRLLGLESSTWAWLKSRSKVPRGPVTVTLRPRMVTFTKKLNHIHNQTHSVYKHTNHSNNIDECGQEKETLRNIGSLSIQDYENKNDNIHP